jgi:hypothetical protein
MVYKADQGGLYTLTGLFLSQVIRHDRAALVKHYGAVIRLTAPSGLVPSAFNACTQQEY